jgi:hypothetical protein
LVPDIIPSSSMKLDESAIDMLQEENINDVCNEAFDEYEDDTLKEAESVEPGLFQYIFPLNLICSRLRYGNPEALGFLLFICCV